jgi:isopenicillin N synthase-like dioxygenase
LLWQDHNGGLEVLGPDGVWVEAKPIEGTLVINVGDLLERWSNDRFASTRHRVINHSGRTRMSIASFYDPSFDAIVDPRDLGVPDGAAHYPPIAAGEHILGRINRSFGYRKSV